MAKAEPEVYGGCAALDEVSLVAHCSFFAAGTDDVTVGGSAATPLTVTADQPASVALSIGARATTAVVIGNASKSSQATVVLGHPITTVAISHPQHTGHSRLKHIKSAEKKPPSTDRSGPRPLLAGRSMICYPNGSGELPLHPDEPPVALGGRSWHTRCSLGLPSELAEAMHASLFVIGGYPEDVRCLGCKLGKTRSTESMSSALF